MTDFDGYVGSLAVPPLVYDAKIVCRAFHSLVELHPLHHSCHYIHHLFHLDDHYCGSVSMEISGGALVRSTGELCTSPVDIL